MCIRVFGITFKSFAFCFRKDKMFFKKKKNLVQDLILPPSIHIHICTLYTYTKNNLLRLVPSGFFKFGLRVSRCLVPTPGPTSVYPTCSVCVRCVYIHIYTHTLQPPSELQKIQTTLLCIFLLKMNNPPATSALHRLAVFPFPPGPFLLLQPHGKSW